MAAPKKPADHKPKSLPVKEVDGGKQVTVDGLKIIVKDAAFTDHLVMRGLAKLRSSDLTVAEKIVLNGEMIDRILGEEQATILARKYEDSDGYTDFTVLAKKFNEILGAAFPNS